MQPVDMQVVGTELAVKWSDGGEDFVALETLRRFCPCAGCLGEGHLRQDLPGARTAIRARGI